MSNSNKTDVFVARFIGGVIGILLALMVITCLGCASTPQPAPDPCEGCPFTERLVQVWSPPKLDPIPAYPMLKAEDFTLQQIRDNPVAYIQALTEDRAILKSSVAELHDWAEDIVSAIHNETIEESE